MWGRRPGRPGGCCPLGVRRPMTGSEAVTEPGVPVADRSATGEEWGPPVEIIVKGRHTDVNDRFRRHVDTKISKVEKLDPKVMRIDVEVSQEHNPRQSDRRERVELTIHSRGP